MKTIVALIIVLFAIVGCDSSKRMAAADPSTKGSDTIRIANEELEYEVIIFEPGFNSWLASVARPRGYYSESFLEERNRLYVMEYNNRVLQPLRFNAGLYEMQINYDSNIRYGYEVNYLLYNYLTYFQIKNKQRLGTFVPRP